MKLIEPIYIIKQETRKKQYLELLLLGDEQESMIDRYLECGEMYVMLLTESGSPIGVAVVTDEGDDVCELKNIAISPSFQRHGYGKRFIAYLCQQYKGIKQIMQVGTGDSVQTTSFYRSCGFLYSHTIPNFFVDHYDPRSSSLNSTRAFLKICRTQVGYISFARLVLDRYSNQCVRTEEVR